MDTHTLPAIETITLDEDVVAVCKEFSGSYDKSSAYHEEVKQSLSERGISYRESETISVFFSDQEQESINDFLTSYQGHLVDEEVKAEFPLFTYKIEKGTYLYTKVYDAELIQPTHQAMLHYIKENDLPPATGILQIVAKRNENVPCFHLYLK